MPLFNKNFLLIAGMVSFLPGLALAGPPPGHIIDFVSLLGNIISALWPLIIGFGVAMFIVIGFGFLYSQGKPEALRKGIQSILYALIGVVVILVSLSIVGIVANSFFQ